MQAVALIPSEMVPSWRDTQEDRAYYSKAPPRGLAFRGEWAGCHEEVVLCVVQDGVEVDGWFFRAVAQGGRCIEFGLGCCRIGEARLVSGNADDLQPANVLLPTTTMHPAVTTKP
jgi:hypothetical protein